MFIDCVTSMASGPQQKLKFLGSQKLCADFQLSIGLMQTPVLFKNQLYISFIYTHMKTYIGMCIIYI